MDIKKLFVSSALLTAVVLALQYVLSLVGYPVKALYSSVQPVSAITGTAGQKVLGWLGGIIPVNAIFTTALLYVFISAMLILFVGNFLVGKFNLPSFKGRVGKLASVILYGTGLFYVVVIGFVMQKWEVIAGLAIHTAIVAFVTAKAADMFKLQTIY